MITPDNMQFAADVLITGQLKGKGSANTKQKAKYVLPLIDPANLLCTKCTGM